MGVRGIIWCETRGRSRTALRRARIYKSGGGGEPGKETEEQFKRGEEQECERLLRAPVSVGSLGAMSGREKNSSTDRTGGSFSPPSKAYRCQRRTQGLVTFSPPQDDPSKA